MMVSTDDVPDSALTGIRRVKAARRSSVAFEVVFIFADKVDRDLAMSHGKNLADYTNEDGRPTAGTRFEYPSHLGKDFRCLDWYGGEMRRRHGKGTRRNFKFDDEEESIYLDICLPGETFWHKIFPYTAKRLKDEMESDRIKSSRMTLEGPYSGTSSAGSSRGNFSTGANAVPLSGSLEANVQAGPSAARFNGYTSPKKRT